MVDLATYDPSIEAQAQDASGKPVPNAPVIFRAGNPGNQIEQVYEADGVSLVPGATLVSNAFAFMPRRVKIDRELYPEVWIDGGAGMLVRWFPSDTDARVSELSSALTTLTSRVNTALGQYGVPKLGSDGLVVATQLPAFATPDQLSEMSAALDAYQASTQSLQDLGGKGGDIDVWPQGGGVVSRSQSNPIAPVLWTATEAFRITAITLNFKSMSLPVSDTAFWTMTPQRVRGGVVSEIVPGGKSTEATGGEAIVAEQPWGYGAYQWDDAAAEFQIGDVFRINFVPSTPTAPAALVAPVTWNFAKEPL